MSVETNTTPFSFNSETAPNDNNGQSVDFDLNIVAGVTFRFKHLNLYLKSDNTKGQNQYVAWAAYIETNPSTAVNYPQHDNAVAMWSPASGEQTLMMLARADASGSKVPVPFEAILGNMKDVILPVGGVLRVALSYPAKIDHPTWVQGTFSRMLTIPK